MHPFKFYCVKCSCMYPLLCTPTKGCIILKFEIQIHQYLHQFTPLFESAFLSHHFLLRQWIMACPSSESILNSLVFYGEYPPKKLTLRSHRYTKRNPLNNTTKYYCSHARRTRVTCDATVYCLLSPSAFFQALQP